MYALSIATPELVTFPLTVPEGITIIVSWMLMLDVVWPAITFTLLG
jgi:hypothetical protein